MGKLFKINARAWIRGREWSNLSIISWEGEGGLDLTCTAHHPVMFWVLIVSGKGRVLHTWRTASPASVLPACTWKTPGVLSRGCSTADFRLVTCLPWGSDLKTTTGPSLTQADRFLLVFRVCFCLAPFEIGYDVGGKAPASEPRGVWSAAACRFLHRQSRKGRSQLSNFFNAYVCGSRS